MAFEFATLEWMDWFNNPRLLEPIGNIPPAEAEQRYYAMLEPTGLIDSSATPSFCKVLIRRLRAPISSLGRGLLRLPSLVGIIRPMRSISAAIPTSGGVYIEPGAPIAVFFVRGDQMPTNLPPSSPPRTAR
jgi:hypothetical protein